MCSIKALALLAVAAVLTTASADSCGSSSDAGCGSTSAGSASSTTDTPTPTTATPTTTKPSTTTATPTVTTATPTTTTSSPSTDTTVAPSTTTATPTTTSSTGSSSTTSTPSTTTASSTTAPVATTTTTTSGSSASSSSTATDSPTSSTASSSGIHSSSSGLSETSSSGTSAVAASTGSSSSKTGLIIGVSGGAVFLLVLAIFICARIRRKKQAKTRSNTPTTYRSLTTPNHASQSMALPPPPPLSPQRASEMWEDSAIMVYRIPLDKVIVQSLVSQGGYGEVYRGMYKGESVAIKKLQPGIRNDIKQINSFLAEAKMMASIEHERLVRFIGVAWDSLRDLCVVTEFMEGGDLRSLLKQFEEEKRLQGFDADKTKIAMHVAHALAYLHSLQPVVIHRDLKSRNILLDNKWNAKLTDFGVSRETSDQTMTAGVGTTLWMAPEVMMGERYDEKADIFSFGVVLTELDSHQMPYANAKNTNSGRTLPDTAILQKVAMGRLQAQFSDAAPHWLRELGAACLSLDPTERPTAGELLYALQRRA